MRKIFRKNFYFSIIFIFLGIIFCFYLFRDKLRMDYIPNKENIASLSEFVLPGFTIEGLYGNHDVDSMIFKYNLFGANPIDTISKIIERAKSNGWQLKEETKSRWRLIRIDHARELWFHSYEEIRIEIGISGNLYLGYIQADSEKISSSLEDTSENYFAERTFWPKFQHFVRETSK